MQIFEYGGASDSARPHAMGKHSRLARSGKSEAVRQASEVQLALRSAWASAIESPGFKAGNPLASLASSALAAMDPERRDAVLAESFDAALGGSRFEAVAWLASLGVGSKPPVRMGASSMRTQTYLGAQGERLMAKSWSAVAAQSGAKALEALEALGVGQAERAGVYQELAAGDPAAAAEAFAAHPWVLLNSILADKWDGARGVQAKDAIDCVARMEAAWRPLGAELVACQRALASEALESWSPSAAKALAEQAVRVDPESSAAARKALAEVIATHADSGGVRMGYEKSMARWFAAGGGPRASDVFEVLAGEFMSALDAPRLSMATRSAMALSRFSKLARSAKGWGRPDPELARSTARDAGALLAAASPRALSEEQRGFMVDALSALDRMSGSKPAAAKRL